jgi:hypothetical protein
MNSLQWLLKPTLLTIALLSLLFPQSTIAASPNWRVIYRPPNRGAPGTSGTGGSRPGCPTMAKPIAAIAPLKSNWGETISARPTLWFYQPYQGDAIEMQFIDETTQTVAFKQKYKSNNAAGIVPLKIAETSPELKPNQIYRWQINFICNGKTQQSYGVSGTIVRREVSQNLSYKLKQAKPENRISLLAAQGLWFDTVNEMALMMRSAPKDLNVRQNWRSLLSQPEVKLDQWKDEPLLE